MPLFEEKINNGEIRLIIASDNLRPEVRSVIEYLNKEMKNAEVFGLEIRYYQGKSGLDDENELVLVPKLYGQTQATMDRKERSIKWTPEELK